MKIFQDDTMKKIQECIDHWGSECAHLNFRPLNGIEKRDLIQGLPARALTPPEVVCEEDATAARARGCIGLIIEV
jgi:hypothetical protein